MTVLTTAPSGRSAGGGHDPEAPMIEAVDVGKRFGSVPALESVSLRVPRGSILGLLGHNGAGKTTLVNVLTAMQPASSGTARVAGFDVATRPKEVRKRIGLTGQFAAVDEQISGRDNLVMLARLLGADSARAKARADELLEAFDLTGAAARRAKTYSGGMRRRLLIARGLVHSPRLVLLDEAFERLDDPTIARMLGLLVDLDMDWLITWPSGWGVSPKIPKMHIYDVLRPRSGHGIACTHTTWDGVGLERGDVR